MKEDSFLALIPKLLALFEEEEAISEGERK